MLAAPADPDELAKSAAIEFAGRLVRRWQEALGTELLGAYLIGSLAHAGFSRLKYLRICLRFSHRWPANGKPLISRIGFVAMTGLYPNHWERR